MTSQPKRRWQFGLRDLAWLTLVAALGLGWWADRQAVLDREEERAARMASEIKSLEMIRIGELNRRIAAEKRAQTFHKKYERLSRLPRDGADQASQPK